MKQVEHDGRKTAYRVAQPDGDGPTVVYVHGSGGTHRLWAAQYGPRGPSHPAVALDLSGHGESEDADAAVGLATIRAYADDVRAVASAVDADMLVGHSLGGAVVQQLLLDGEVAVDGAMLAGTGAALPVAESLRERLATEFEAAIDWLHDEGRLFYDTHGRTIQQSRATMQSVGATVTERDFLSCHEFDVRERVSEIDCPVLAVVGEYDRLTPVSNHERLADELPNGRLAVVEDAGHMAMIERPTAFAGAIEAFLAD